MQIRPFNDILFIGRSLFWGNMHLHYGRSIASVIPTSVTYLGNKAFFGTKIERLVLPTSLSSIGKRAFQNCEILVAVVFPTAVVSVGRGAFYGCGSLENIALPPFLTSIDSLVFQGCTKLKSVSTSIALQSIGDSSFDGCSRLQQLPNLIAVTSIGVSAFQGCSSLVQVTLSATVQSIGDSSFADCIQLMEVSIPNSNTVLKTIALSAFSGCYNLARVTLSSSIKTIARGAFRGCSALTTVVMPNVAAIQPEAFDGDMNLNCLISQNQLSVTTLVRSSCLPSSSTCAPLSGCPVQLQYTFSNDTVAGSMVANVANNFQDFDATLQNGATVSHNRLQLVSKNQQFMQLKEFSVYTTERTLTFWFNAISVSSGAICEFNEVSEEWYYRPFRIYLSFGILYFAVDSEYNNADGKMTITVNANEWYHVAWVQTIQSSDDNVAGCDWSIFLNGKIVETNGLECAMSNSRFSMRLNYVGKSSADNSIAYFDGSIRDFRLYNSALKSYDIESIYANTNPTLSPTIAPTAIPSTTPTVTPTASPTAMPTGLPSIDPTSKPTTYIPTMTPSFLPTASPTSPSAFPTYVPTDIGVAISPLSNSAIAGIVVASVVVMLGLFVGFYFYLRPKLSFMDIQMIEKQKEFRKFSGEREFPNHSPSCFEPLMDNLTALLVDGEKWRRCYHSEREHGEQCFVELWRSPLNDTVTLMCTDCPRPYKAINAETMPKKFEYERRKMDEDREKYDFEPCNSANRGLTIGFLVEFCRKFDLWKVPTWQVRRDYIIPMTKDFRCRFVDLPDMQESGIVGLADIFISFSNATLFGDLIAAISDGADYRRRVWIDIFAVMQWPSAKSDLNFDQVIRRCPTFLSVCPSVEAVGKRKNIFGNNELPDEDKIMIPYFRVWCLFEIFHAATFKKDQESQQSTSSETLARLSQGDDDRQSVQIVGDGLDIETAAFQGSSHQTLTILFKTGSCEFNPDGSHTFKVDKKMLADLIDYINIEEAGATSDNDKTWIKDQIRTGYSRYGGLDGLNALVKDVLKTAKVLDPDPILECAVRGESRAIEAIHSRPELYILNAVRGGLADQITNIMKVKVDSMVNVSIFNRLDVEVRIYMVSYDGASINNEVNIEKHSHVTKLMSEGSFWIARKLVDDSDVGVHIATTTTKKWIIY
eukprot:gene23474-31825_t